MVDLPTLAPVPQLRDPEKAPEPVEAPEPNVEPEPAPQPEPEPDPVPEPAPEPEPTKAEPEPAPPVEQPDPAPQPDLTLREEFAAPAETPAPPSLPEPPAAAAPEGPIAGDLSVGGEQTPAREAPPLTTPEKATPSPQPGPDARTAAETGPKKKEEEAGDDPAPAIVAKPKPATGDDAFDQAPAYATPRFSLPKVDLPQGAKAAPGTSGVVAVFCPEEFKNKDKAAECAGRTDIRSGWRPGASGEDFSKAAKVLQQRRQEGDFSGDGVTYGPAIAREADEARRRRDLEDFRKSQGSVNDLGTNQTQDPAAATRPNIGPADFEPSWTKREDPLVDQKDVDKLKRDLEQAEKDKNGGN
jgi:hypothetical protein